MRLVFAVVSSALLGSCTPPQSLLDQIRELGELRVVTQNAPTTFYYGATERHGIEYELARAFADHLGVRLRLSTVDQLEQMLPKIVANEAHIAAAGLRVTDSRSEIITFGPGYQTVRPTLICRMGSDCPESLEATAGKIIEVRAGSSHVELLADAFEQTPGLIWAEYRSASSEPLMQRVAEGIVDYAIVGSNEFDLLRHYYPDVQAAFELDAESELAWALPRHALDLRQAVAAFFAEIEATGQLQRILDRYYVAHRDFDFVGSRAFVRHLNERFPEFQQAFLDAERETGIDWKLLAAIAYQESHWNAEAVSPTGVTGLMMLTANTAREVGVTDRTDPRQSILGGARYLASVIDMFPERIPDQDRMLMALAAYNIGFGHVEDARIITESKNADKDSWDDVRRHLPLLSDEQWYPHLRRGYAQGTVPVQYVERVRHYHWLLDRLTGIDIFSALNLSTEDSAADRI